MLGIYKRRIAFIVSLLLLSAVLLSACNNSNAKRHHRAGSDMEAFATSVSENILNAYELSSNIPPVTLDLVIANTDISQDFYINLVEEYLGEQLTQRNLTEDIRVPSADQHHVSQINNLTVIFLHYPSDSVTEEMFNYYRNLMSWDQVIHNTDYSVLISNDALSFIKGNTQIIFGGDYDSINDLMDEIEYPNMELLLSLID